MSIERGDFEAISETDLVELVESQVAESIRVEFKLESYGNRDRDKKEFLKDVSAFANSHGGHLVLGIREDSGVAESVVGIDLSDPDAEVLRLENLVRDGLEPRITGFQIKTVLLQNGKHVLLLRIPRSWNPPHRVIAQGSNRFFVRHSAGVHEPNVEELRYMFSVQQSAIEFARSFREKRLAEIVNATGPWPLIGDGRLILHIVPVASCTGNFSIDVREAYKRHSEFRPFGAQSSQPRYNVHGFINIRGGDDNHGYTQVFRNGILEATIGNRIRQNDQLGRFIPGTSLEEYFFQSFPDFINGLRLLEVPPPLIVMLTLEGVAGVHYIIRRPDIFDELDPPLPNNVMTLPECVQEEYGEEVDYHRAVKPAFDALWNSIGRAEAGNFNADGLWVRPAR